MRHGGEVSKMMCPAEQFRINRYPHRDLALLVLVRAQFLEAVLVGCKGA